MFDSDSEKFLIIERQRNAIRESFSRFFDSIISQANELLLTEIQQNLGLDLFTGQFIVTEPHPTSIVPTLKLNLAFLEENPFTEEEIPVVYALALKIAVESALQLKTDDIIDTLRKAPHLIPPPSEEIFKYIEQEVIVNGLYRFQKELLNGSIVNQIEAGLKLAVQETLVDIITDRVFKQFFSDLNYLLLRRIAEEIKIEEFRGVLFKSTKPYSTKSLATGDQKTLPVPHIVVFGNFLRQNDFTEKQILTIVALAKEILSEAAKTISEESLGVIIEEYIVLDNDNNTEVTKYVLNEILGPAFQSLITRLGSPELAKSVEYHGESAIIGDLYGNYSFGVENYAFGQVFDIAGTRNDIMLTNAINLVYYLKNHDELQLSGNHLFYDFSGSLIEVAINDSGYVEVILHVSNEYSDTERQAVEARMQSLKEKCTYDEVDGYYLLHADLAGYLVALRIDSFSIGQEYSSREELLGAKRF